MGRRDLYKSLDTSADGIGAQKMKAQIAELQKSGVPDRIDPNILVRSPYQPRTTFPPEEMVELTESILSVGGVLVPVIARPGSNELIAGERRTLVAIELGIESIPVHWHECTDRQAAEFTAFENVKRADLNAIDETNMVLNMIVLRLGLPDRQAAIDLIQKIHGQKDSRREVVFTDNVISKNIVSLVEETIKHFTKGSIGLGSFCTNKLKLLNLQKELVEAIQSDRLEYTKASQIAKITDEVERTDLLDRAVEEGLSVQQIKDEVAKVQPQQSKKKKQPTPAVKKTEADLEKQELLDLEINEDDSPKEPVGGSAGRALSEYFADSDEAIDSEIFEAVTKIRFVFDNDSSISHETKVKVMELLSQVVHLIA
jgi:ParB family transcriptional regulator, chromosome partitioning protein